MRKTCSMGVTALLVFSLVLAVQVSNVFAMPLVSWTPWSYHSAPANPPTTGQGATRWAEDGWWQYGLCRLINACWSPAGLLF